MPQLPPKQPRTTALTVVRTALTLLLLSGAACTHKIGVTPAEATCEGACAVMPACGSGALGLDAGAECLASCNTAQADCATVYRSATFQESLACLTNASYSCEEADHTTFAATSDCQNLQSYVENGQVKVGCVAGP